MERACKSSGELAVSTQVTTTPALIWEISLRSGTTSSSTVIRDGGAGGTILWALSGIATTTAGDVTTSKTFPKPLICSTSLYVTMAGTGALGYVGYEVVS